VKIALTHADLPNETKGGVAHQAHALGNVLAGRGHDVTFFTFSPAWDECRYQVRQLTPPRGRGLKRFGSFLFARALAGVDFSGFDMIHVNGDGYLIRRGPGRPPLLRTFYGSARDEAKSAVRLRRRVYQNVLSLLEARDARNADLCVGISAATQARIPAVSQIISCGVDLSRFRLGLKSAHPSVLFVGTAGGRKRGQFLADVFTHAVRPRFPDAELWTVADRPLMGGGGIVNHGRVSFEMLGDLYRRAWVFCLPSTYEGFGVPYIEALASGTSVVASPNAGAREVLQNGAWGSLAEDADLGKSIVRLLGNPDERSTWETRGLERAGDFAWDRVAAQYERLYTDLIRAKNRAEPAAPFVEVAG